MNYSLIILFVKGEPQNRRTFVSNKVGLEVQYTLISGTH